MVDKTENLNSTDVRVCDDNQDDLILQQQRRIEQEINDSIALIGELEPISSLQREYTVDTVYQQKVSFLEKKYKYVRRTRPDGNCFYRSFGYAYLERLLNDPVEYKRFHGIAAGSKDNLVELGFPKFTVEDFHETFMGVIERIGRSECTASELHETFNTQGYSDYIVVYLRLITSGQLQKDSEFYQNFIEGDRTVSSFCHHEVEPMYRESDHIHIIALSTALGVGIRVRYMDRGEGGEVIPHDFPEGSTPAVHLLYRPVDEVEAVAALLALPFKMNTNEVKLQILQRGRPQPVLITPKKETVRGGTCTFNISWYESYPWLCGSTQLNKLFCWPCLLMRPESSSWCATGIDDFKRLIALASKHSTCKTHLRAIAEYDGTVLEAGLPPEFVNQTSTDCKMEKESDSESDYLGKFLTPKRAVSTTTERQEQPSTGRPTLTFRAWQQASRAMLDQGDPKLVRRRRRLAAIEIKNAELMGEKLRLEIQLLKSKLELQRAINVNTIGNQQDDVPPDK